MSIYTRLYDFMAGATVRSQEFDDEFNAIASASRTNVRAVDEITADLPNAVSRANKLLSFDASGQPQATNSVPDPVADMDVANRRWVQTLALTGVISVGPGDAGKVMTNNGTTIQWTTTDSLYPNQTGNSGKFLTTNGTSVSWASAFPAVTGNEGKALALDSAAAPAWVEVPDTWANWTLITANGGTFTVPAGRSRIRAYVFGKGGSGSANGAGGAGGGGGGCTFGTIPCKPGDVFTFDNSGTTAVLKKSTTAYLTANNGTNASGTTKGAGGAAGTVGSGLGITSSGAYAGGDGCVGGLGGSGGGGGSSGSPLGAGVAAVSGSGAGWGSAGTGQGGGGVTSDPTTVHIASPCPTVGSRLASRDWTSAFADPLLRLCNGVAPPAKSAYVGGGATNFAVAAPAGCGGDIGSGAAASRDGGHGGLGGGGACGLGTAGAGGQGGFGGGGGIGTGTAAGGISVVGGGGGASVSGTPGDSTSGVIIFW